MAFLYAMTSSMRILRCLPTFRCGMAFWSRSLIRNGRETFKTSAAWTVVSSALSGISVTPWPQQIFVSYYLSDTSVENGCLKVIPGTHHKRITLHDELVPAHEQGARYIEEDHPVMFGDHPDQVDVCVRARSFVLADARVLHSARRNLTDERRTLILAWHRRRDDVWHEPPAYWEGEIPEVLANRDADREYERSRIPGEHLE